MFLSGILPRIKGISRNDRTAAIEGQTVAFEMDLHVPCRVSGITRKGLRWEGGATTASISSFGAHFLVPSDAELEGEISLVFKIPAALRLLFPKRKFRLNAEIKPSGGPGPGMIMLGRKIIYAVFEEPLNFRLRS